MPIFRLETAETVRRLRTVWLDADSEDDARAMYEAGTAPELVEDDPDPARVQIVNRETFRADMVDEIGGEPC